MTERNTAVYDLGEDGEQVTFKLNGKEFQCFPLDEIEYIGAAANDRTPPALKGEPFLEVLQERLKRRYGVTASAAKASQWYEKLHEAHKVQLDFFAQSPASSGSTSSTPAGANSAVSGKRKSASSRRSATASKRKK